MSNHESEHARGAGLVGGADTPPDQVAALYDEWAVDDYDDDVTGWGYEAPRRVAEMVVAQRGDASGEVLDAGCGTGQVGAALRSLGVETIVGGDFTPRSVEVARASGSYREVEHLDLNGPLAFADDRFAAAVSVGVFSYVADTTSALKELLRIVRPGGVVVFTQRTDLWDERDCGAVIASLVSSGMCDAVTSDPSPYLPGHPDFGTDIGIIYTTLTVA